MKSWLRGHVKAFWDVRDWLAAMSGYDFVTGTRFHGAIAAIDAACEACHAAYWYPRTPPLPLPDDAAFARRAFHP